MALLREKGRLLCPRRHSFDIARRNHEENMIVVGGDGYQMTGTFFDRARCSLALRKGARPCKQFTILLLPAISSSSAVNLRIRRAMIRRRFCSRRRTELLVREITLNAGGTMGERGLWSPSSCIVYPGLVDCVVTSHAMNEGALPTLLLDVGGTADGAIVRDNPGRVFRLDQPRT